MADGATPQVTASGWWDRTMFNVTGWLVCFWYGKLDRYAMYLAQAKVENGVAYEGRAFREGKNPWCMHTGTLSARRVGTMDFGDEGVLAKYDAFGAAWLDRVQWDDKMGVPLDCKPSELPESWVAAGWLGSGATTEQRANYASKVHTVHDDYVSWWAKVWEPFSGWMKLVLWILVMGLLAFLLWWLWKRYKRWRHGR